MELFIPLSKILSLLVYPVGLVCALLLLSVLSNFGKAKRTSLFLSIGCFLILYLSSTPWLAQRLIDQLQGEYPPVAAVNLQAVDCAIVLGGMVSESGDSGQSVNYHEAIDRAIQAAALYRQQRVQRLVIAAGNIQVTPSGRSEADWILGFMLQLGVDRSDITLESSSRNTRENALQTLALYRQLGCEGGLLVTSAYHMPRAMAVFDAAGFSLEAFPVDFVAAPGASSTMKLLPTVEALQITTLAIKEHLGYLVYRLLGWV